MFDPLSFLGRGALHSQKIDNNYKTYPSLAQDYNHILAEHGTEHPEKLCHLWSTWSRVDTLPTPPHHGGGCKPLSQP